MIGGLLLIFALVGGGYVVGQARPRRPRHAHQPRALRLVDQLRLPPGAILESRDRPRGPGFLNPGAALHNATRHMGELEIGRSRNRAIKIGCTGGLADDRCWTGSDGTIHHGVNCRAAYECDEVAEVVGRVLDRALPKV